MNENIIDALIYSGIKNNIKESDWTFISPDYRNLLKILDKTTVKRACCLNKGKAGTEGDKEYTIKVRIPMPKNIDGLDLEKKYNYYDKEISIPANICDMPELADFKYNGEGGDTQCDNFFKAYCQNIVNDYKKLSGADKDPKKFDMNEFAKFKPECACYIPPLDGLTKEQKMVPHCWFAQCGTSPYRPTNLRTECKLNIQQCIQNVTNQIGSVDSSQVAIDKASLVNNCSQDTSSAGNKTSDSVEKTTFGSTNSTQSQGSTPTTYPSQPSPTLPQSQTSTKENTNYQETKNNTVLYIGIGVIILIIIIVIIIFAQKKKTNTITITE